MKEFLTKLALKKPLRIIAWLLFAFVLYLIGATVAAFFKLYH